MNKKFNPDIHHRRSIRLSEYDYSMNGLYFITICIHQRESLLGEISNGEMKHSDAGKMIEEMWLNLEQRFPQIGIDMYVVMPNHFHGIIGIYDDYGMDNKLPIGRIIGAFKSLTTREYIKGIDEEGWPPFNKRLWQRNFYEHIIRNDAGWNRIKEYIYNNPMNWDEDENNINNAIINRICKE